MDTDNRVLNPNPYGSIGTQEIEQFEARLPHRLPQDYRDYLLQNNGGDFEKPCFVSKENAEITHSVSELFSLFRGPENTRLETHWSLSEYYDLLEFSHLTKDYLVFGVTGTGDLFLLRLGKGDVLIYLHDHVEQTPIEAPGGAIFPLACSFSDFASNMVSRENFLQVADEIEPGFAARLERLKKESGMWD